MEAAQAANLCHRGISVMRAINDLPIEWLEQVLSYLSLTQVVTCQSVSRRWYLASRSVLRHWSRLVLKPQARASLFVTPVETSESPRDVVAVSASRQADVARSLLPLLQHLSHLQLAPCCSEADWLPLVQQNAASLISIRNCSLGIRETRLPCLRELQVRVEWSEEGAILCPAIEKLHVDYPSSCRFLRTIVNPLRMRAIDIQFSPTADGSEAAAQAAQAVMTTADVVSHLLRMANLTHLSLRLCRGAGNAMAGRAVAGDPPLGRLFGGFSRLEEFEVRDESGSGDRVNVDLFIDHLVSGNPRLRKIVIWRLTKTDASLRSLSRLRHLAFLDVRSKGSFSTDAVMQFLSGRSRHCLSHVMMYQRESLDGDRLQQEVEELARESGRRVVRKLYRRTVYPDGPVVAFHFVLQANASSE